MEITENSNSSSSCTKEYFATFLLNFKELSANLTRQCQSEFILLSITETIEAGHRMETTNWIAFISVGMSMDLAQNLTRKLFLN